MSSCFNSREFISRNTGGSLFFCCLYEIFIDNYGYTMYSKYCHKEVVLEYVIYRCRFGLEGGRLWMSL